MHTKYENVNIDNTVQAWT